MSQAKAHALISQELKEDPACSSGKALQPEKPLVSQWFRGSPGRGG